MCQNSWYDKKRRHYGPKPNTRRARGLKRRDTGLKKGPATQRPIYTMEAVQADTNVKQTNLPYQMKTMKRYAKIYNWYVQHFDRYPDKKLCLQATIDKFGLCDRTVMHAIRVCKYLLATS